MLSAQAFALAAVAATALGCSALRAQQSSQGAPQSSSSQVSGAPAPANPPVPAQSQFSSSSSPVPEQPRYWSNPDPGVQVTVLENTLLRVRTNEPISSRQTRPGALLSFTLSSDVLVDNVLIIPRGATLHGELVRSRQAGRLTGSAELTFQLTSLDLAGRSYPLYTYEFQVEGTSKTRPTETKVKTGAAVGAIVGSVFSGSAHGETTAVGRLAGLGTGAAIGAGVGTAVAASTRGPIVSLPAESEMDFYLASPISVVPATEKEARHLAEGLHAGGPALYVRGDTP